MLKTLDSFGVNVGVVLALFGALVIIFAFTISDLQLNRTLGFAVQFSPIWLPVILFLIFYEKWLGYVQLAWTLAQDGRVSLEILLPEEIYKSPEAMEIILTQLYQTASPDTLFQTYLDGKHPPTFSLEMVSNGGTVHFYINVPRKKWKNLIETHLYAQYPGIEVRELPVDYTAEIAWDDETFEVFGMHFVLKEDEVYPIRTYYDYGLSDNPKEEEKHDPITAMLDHLASITPDERIWIQILISAHREEKFEVGSLFRQEDWKPRIKAEVNKVLQECKNRQLVDEGSTMTQMTDSEKQKISALERSYSKYPFNTAIRAVYAAKTGHFNSDRIGGVITSWFPYNDNNLNGFRLGWRTDISYKMWSDRKGTRINAMKKRELDRYKRRVYYNENQKDKKFVMTTEELATIFHLPGKVLLTPNLGRIPSTRGEAPPNLPVGQS